MNKKKLRTELQETLDTSMKMWYDDDGEEEEDNNSVQLFTIKMLRQQPDGQIQIQHKRKTTFRCCSSSCCCCCYIQTYLYIQV